MSRNKIIAIDPGASGGIVWTDDWDNAQCSMMGKTNGDTLDLLRILSCSGHRTAFIEHVVGFIPMAGQGAMFEFGKNYGFLMGCLMALNYRVEIVRPSQWQKALSLGNKKDHGKQWKNHLKATAQRLFPNCEVTLKTADALLIYHYATTKIVL